MIESQTELNLLPEVPTFPTDGDTWQGLGETWVYRRLGYWVRIGPNVPGNYTVSHNDLGNRIYNHNQTIKTLLTMQNDPDRRHCLRLRGTQVLTSLVTLGYELSEYSADYLKSCGELFSTLGRYASLADGVKYEITAEVITGPQEFSIELNPNQFVGGMFAVIMTAKKSEVGTWEFRVSGHS